MSEKINASLARRARIHKIHDILKKEGEMDLKLLVANIEYQTGLTELKIKTYLMILVDLGYASIDAEGLVRVIK